MFVLNVVYMHEHLRPCLLRRLCLVCVSIRTFEHTPGNLILAIVYRLFSLINVELSALYV